MDSDSTEWITLREAEQIIGRSRRQIWRYIYDGSWDTKAVMDDMNRHVTYVKKADILRKKTEIESASNLNHVSITEKEMTGGIGEDGEINLTIIRQLLERFITGQEYQNNLIKKCLYILEGINITSIRIFLIVILIGIVVLAACSIINIISD